MTLRLVYTLLLLLVVAGFMVGGVVHNRDTLLSGGCAVAFLGLLGGLILGVWDLEEER